MTKTRAALLHFLVSALVVGVVLSIVFFAWYPGLLFPLSGAISPVLVMIGVDVTLGPLLTFIVYRQGKPGLKFDLGFIFTVQLIALCYGSLTLYNERPHFLVFAKDSFTAVSARQVELPKLRYPELARKPLVGVNLVFARMPEEPAEVQALLESVLFEGQPDLERRAEFFEPYANGAEQIRMAATGIDDFVPQGEAEQRAISKAKDRYGDRYPALGLIPTRTLETDYAVLLDLESLELLTVVRVDAWGKVHDDGEAPASGE